MNLVIRKAGKQDWDPIKRVLSENQLPTADIFGNSILFFVALTENRIIGTIGLEHYNSVGLLRSLAVSKAFRNRRTGEKLIRHVFDLCSDRGIKELYLLTTTADTYFNRFGFQTIDRSIVPDVIKQTSEFREICPSPAIIMYREGNL